VSRIGFNGKAFRKGRSDITSIDDLDTSRDDLDTSRGKAVSDGDDAQS